MIVQAVPSSVPFHGGFVELEGKKGKWNKRWLELREHSLFLSKKEVRYQLDCEPP